VKDAVEMTLHFAEKAEQAGASTISARAEANTWLALTNAIFAALGRPPKIEFIDMPDVLRGKYQYFTQADTSKLRASATTGPSRPWPRPCATMCRDISCRQEARGLNGSSVGRGLRSAPGTLTISGAGKIFTSGDLVPVPGAERSPRPTTKKPGRKPG